MVRPLQKWLEEREVQLELNVRVTDLFSVRGRRQEKSVRILFVRGETPTKLRLVIRTIVIVTLGSMTEASSLGSMDSAPVLNVKTDGGAWTLWKRLRAGRPEFGRPSVFTDQIEESKWVSFTATQRDPSLLPSDPGPHGQRARRRRTDHLCDSVG